MKTIYLSTLLLFVSLTSLAQWSQVNNGIVNLTMGAKLLNSSNTHLFSGTLGGQKMYRTNNNGNNWTETQPPVAGNVPECGYYASGKYFSGLNSSMDCIYYTTDNGTTWNTVAGGPQTTVVRGFCSLSGNIFAYTSNKGVYKSTDGGANWTAANSGMTNLNVIRMETMNTKIIAVTIGAGVFVSSDNGSTWVQSNTGIAGGDLNASLVWRMGGSLYYTAQGGGSYSSINEGANWTVWTKPIIMGLGINEVYRNGTNLYIEARHFSGGLKDSIYSTSNEGGAWTNITSNLSASNLNADGITEFGGNVFIAYNISSPGLGIYRKTTTVGIIDNYLSDLINVYPNPFNDKIVLSNLSSKKIKQISMYNNQGKLIILDYGNNSAINTTGLKHGLYILKILLSDNSTIHKKLLK